MSQEQIAGSPRSLEWFAYRVAGPRDFVINLLINTTVAWLVLRGSDSVPLVGGRSLLAILAPMIFLLSTLTTFFGYFNGVKERKSGTVTPPLNQEAVWMPVAIRSGLMCGILALAACLVLVLSLNRLLGAPHMPAWVAIPGLGSFAAVWAYILHARAVLRSGQIPSQILTPSETASG